MVQTASQPSQLIGWMESLSDPTRLRLVRLLERHELGVVELCDVLQMPQSTVSRHLKSLGDMGWVTHSRQGTTRLYRTRMDDLAPAARKLWIVAREQTDSWPTVQQDQLRVDRVLRDREVDGETFFAGAASEWDRLRQELYGDRFSTAAMLATLPRDMVVADLGCGSGHLAMELAPFVKTVIGIDASPAMLKAAKKRCTEVSNVDLRRGDLADVPINTGSCDAAMMVLALTYVPDPAAAVAELARLLKPGGRGVIVDLLPHDRDEFRRKTGQTAMGFEPAVIGRLMAEAGLVNGVTRPLPAEPNVKGPGLFLAAGQKFLPPMGHR